MTRDSQSGIELLGDALPYADGAEDELTTILAGAGDRSSTSDELASRIHDWPTRYHLSRQRSNLVRPLSIRPGLRVLDVGAGTGAIARCLGEQGADVVALEGSLSRARAAALRCEELPNVRVVCGSVEDLQVDRPFDLVLVVGVLEYAEHVFGGGRGPASFLASIRRLTAPDGAVALAIENQLGLKYLLGGAEDHLGESWAGVEGYRRPGGIRTYSRRALARLLDDAGLAPQRWLYPCPDYKLPTVVLSEHCFAEPDARLLVDQLVRTPVVDFAHPRASFCDDRGAADTFVAAGLGEEVANSFLVLAGDPSAVTRLVDDDVLAWHFGSERLAMWLRTKTIVRRAGARTVEAVPRVDVARERGWLSQQVTPSEPFVAGPTVERLVVDALAQHDLATVGKVLTAWRESVSDAATDVATTVGPSPHPFRRQSTTRVLPQDHLDVDTANFVRDGEGMLHYVDREWCVLGGVDLDLALTRALWNLAYRLVSSGAEIPWSPTTTVDELTVTLGSLCGVDVGPALLRDWREAEDVLQSLVTGVHHEDGTERRVAEGRLSRSQFPVIGQVPFTTLRRDVLRLDAEIAGVRSEAASATAHAAAVEQALEAARRELAEKAAEHEEASARLREELERAQSRLSDWDAALIAANEELTRHRARAAAFERRLLVRVYRRLLRRPRSA